jgi:hypothetical protein
MKEFLQMLGLVILSTVGGLFLIWMGWGVTMGIVLIWTGVFIIGFVWVGFLRYIWKKVRGQPLEWKRSE